MGHFVRLNAATLTTQQRQSFICDLPFFVAAPQHLLFRIDLWSIAWLLSCYDFIYCHHHTQHFFRHLISLASVIIIIFCMINHFIWLERNPR